jgi:hypothetical protein
VAGGSALACPAGILDAPLVVCVAAGLATAVLSCWQQMRWQRRVLDAADFVGRASGRE